MADKRFWYIKLNVNFFDDERIDWLCEQENGYEYVVLYLKLCLKTLNTNGILKRQVGTMIIPYDTKKISEITKIKLDTVMVALELFKKLSLIYEADGECTYMRIPDVPEMVGYTTQYALQKAKYRESKSKNNNCDIEKSDIVQDIVQDIVSQELRVKSLELRDKSLELRDKSLEKEKIHEGEQDKLAPTTIKKFKKPCVEEIKTYCEENNINVDAEHFFDYYESNGWKVGKNAMKNWHATVKNWGRREKIENKSDIPTYEYREDSL